MAQDGSKIGTNLCNEVLAPNGCIEAACNKQCIEKHHTDSVSGWCAPRPDGSGYSLCLCDDAQELSDDMVNALSACSSFEAIDMAGCRAHGNVDVIEFPAWKLMELTPENSGFYVVLSLSVCSKWEDGSNVCFIRI
ncbi:hypothetical protein TEA_014869 [Camellia sinensis var. sinensis]|uniref:Uncharacterized protein n=1 Tax=Camellia sinensis var. sinensis TaxID=542762 RepID=A0A4S4DMX7_CAMSN|nr:hypothetical protein TEA_014869 [Camellia sinensis var. sinensis]